MRTYFSKDFSQASKWELDSILDELEKISLNSITTIQWNSDDDSLYGVSYLDESVDNSSDHGYIWHYEPTCNLLAEVRAQIQINQLVFEQRKLDYNYDPRNMKDFFHNANIITQYKQCSDDDYQDYYHNTALLLAVQIDINQINDFEVYVDNNKTTISVDDAIKYIHNKIKGNKQ
jgi:hypothetical protein